MAVDVDVGAPASVVMQVCHNIIIIERCDVGSELEMPSQIILMILAWSLLQSPCANVLLLLAGSTKLETP